MSKALLGARLGPTELALLDEVRRLRAHVAELEAALAARATGDCACGEAERDAAGRDVPAPAAG
jgi:hypothetical protein